MKNSQLKKGLISLLLLVSIVLNVIPVMANGFSSTEVIEWKVKKEGCESAQELINHALPSQMANNNAQWFAMFMLLDNDVYETKHLLNASDEYLESNHELNQIDYLRFALLYLTMEEEIWFKNKVATIDETSNIINRAYFLHVINAEDEKDAEKIALEKRIINSVIKNQFDDGGWAVVGKHSDVDVTAMVLQALAHYKEDERVEESIQKGIDFLSKRQNENGTFSSLGTQNAESCAQVIMALCALDISPKTDERFTKDTSAWEGLLLFGKEQGAFAHLENGYENEYATVQALGATVALDHFETNKGALFDFVTTKKVDEEKSSDANPVDEQTKGTTITEETVVTKEETQATIDIKKIGYGVILGVAIVLAIALFYRKRTTKKTVLVYMGVVCAILLLWAKSDFRTKDAYFEQSQEVIKEAIEVDFSIKIKVENGEDEWLLMLSKRVIEKGSTVYELLVNVCREENIVVDASGGDGAKYVKGINQLYEFDKGPESGWIFRVNGIVEQQSAAQVKLEMADVVEWIYTLQLGADVQ